MNPVHWFYMDCEANTEQSLLLISYLLYLQLNIYLRGICNHKPLQVFVLTLLNNLYWIIIIKQKCTKLIINLVRQGIYICVFTSVVYCV